MASSYSNRAQSMLGDYANIRTIPATLSAVFVLATLYQFGGITTVELPWLSYTLTAQHAMLVSMGTYAVAFASSETMRFEHYETYEQALIALGPLLIIGAEYVPVINDTLLAMGDPLGYQLAFLASLVSWTVTVQ